MIHWFIQHLLCVRRRDRPDGKQGMKASWVVYGVRKTKSTPQPCSSPLVPVLTTSSLRPWVSPFPKVLREEFPKLLELTPSSLTVGDIALPPESSPSPSCFANCLSLCFLQIQTDVNKRASPGVCLCCQTHTPEMLHYLWVKHEPNVLAHLNTQYVLYRNFYLNIRSVGSFESFICKL